MIFKKEARSFIAVALFVFLLNHVEEHFVPQPEDPRRQRYEEQIEKMVATGRFALDAQGRLQPVLPDIPCFYSSLMESGVEIPASVKNSRRFKLWNMKYEMRKSGRD